MRGKVRLVLAVALAAALLVAGATSYASNVTPAGVGGFVPGEILVRFAPGTTAVEAAALHRAQRATIKDEVRDLEVQVVEVPAGREAAAISAYQSSGKVSFAEPNYVVTALYTPNDTYYNATYNSSHAGLVAQWDLPKVGAPTVWETSRNLSTNVMVAVVDTGVDYSHPDLSNKVARDAGGAIVGYNFVANNADPRDDNGHGTHVTGTVAAQTDNGAGVAALSFNAVKVMPVKVLDQTGSGSVAGVANGITWAADHGARVISMSLGSTSYSQTLANATDYAWGKGVFITAAAGNDGRTVVEYPAGNNYVLGVGASDQADALASFSSTGRHVGVAAPGVSILSTMPTYTAYLNTQYGYYTYYDALNGTSMATPHVASLAGLLMANNPNLTNLQVYQLLQETAENVAGTANGGWVKTFGYGRLNAANAFSGTQRLATVGGIYGQVIKLSGAAASGVIVSAGGLKFKTGTDGMFRLANLAPGTYTVTAASKRYGTVSGTATVTGGGDFLLKLKLPK